MGLVGLFFLSHSHYLFYKPYPSLGKHISLIKNDTVEKVWTHHAKSFPVPGEIKAKDRLREKSFLALPGSLAVWCSHAEYRYTKHRNFPANQGWAYCVPSEEQRFLADPSPDILADWELEMESVVPFMEWFTTGPSFSFKEAERNDSSGHHAEVCSEGGGGLLFMNFEKGIVGTLPSFSISE